MVVQISVGQVENFDKSVTWEISEMFSSTSLNIQLFDVCIMLNTKTWSQAALPLHFPQVSIWATNGPPPQKEEKAWH